MNENGTPNTRLADRELSRRSNSDIEVVLLWSESTGQITVCVTDQKEGSYFELRPPPELALEVFNHPYSYADHAFPRYDDARLVA
jgi:hypothetical protein